MREYKLLLLFVFSFIQMKSIAQFSKFNQGFNEGFKKGYCYTSNQNSSYFCTPPLPPLPPLPQITESSNSWDDGYNRGFLVGRAKRDQDDYKQSDPNSNSSSYVPKFNPYVPTSPILLLTPEERERYFEARAARQQAQAEAIASLLEAIFTPKEITPEERLQREIAKMKRKQDIQDRKTRKMMEKDAKRLIVGTDKYIQCKKSQKTWFRVSAITAVAAAYTFFQANNYATKYNSATNDAASIRKKANTFFQIAPICLLTSGIGMIKFAINKNKIRKAKPKSTVTNPVISIGGNELSLSLNF